MKRIIKTLTAFIAITLLTLNMSVFAGSPPPPPPPGHNSSGNVPGGGAPIAGGIGILLALGAAYGGKKVYDYKKRKLAE